MVGWVVYSRCLADCKTYPLVSTTAKHDSLGRVFMGNELSMKETSTRRTGGEENTTDT